MKNEEISILIIYTGGTIGMVKNPGSGTLLPFNFAQIEKQVPELRSFGFRLNTHEFKPPIDSSDMSPDVWIDIAGIIEKKYDSYDGFVILHGTDTMAYTASALSFMLGNLSKPVILTGSQLPLGTLRTDGKENLISAIEIAAATINGVPLVPEVCIYFEYKLYRGNRTTKLSADQFQAFSSENYPLLAESGIEIKYNYSAIRKIDERKKLKVYKTLNTNVALLKIFPGLNREFARFVFHVEGIQAIIIESYGNGNAPSEQWFIDLIQDAITRNIIVLNITQCPSGSVEMKRYESGIHLYEMGVTSGRDMTTEAAIAKIMFLLARYDSVEQIKEQLNTSICGEITDV